MYEVINKIFNWEKNKLEKVTFLKIRDEKQI